MNEYDERLFDANKYMPILEKAQNLSEAADRRDADAVRGALREVECETCFVETWASKAAMRIYTAISNIDDLLCRDRLDEVEWDWVNESAGEIECEAQCLFDMEDRRMRRPGAFRGKRMAAHGDLIKL